MVSDAIDEDLGTFFSCFICVKIIYNMRFSVALGGEKSKGKK